MSKILDKKVLNKKVLIPIILVVLFLVGAASFFLWQYYNNQQTQIEDDLKRLADYVVEETLEGKIIKSINGDLEVKMPIGWYFRKELKYFKEKNLVNSNYFVGHVEILSPELFKSSEQGIETNIFKSKTGCLIEIGAIEGGKSFEELKEEIKENLQYFKLESEEKFEIIEIDNHNVLKNVFDSSSVGHCVAFYIPCENKIHSLALFSSQENKEKCSQEFDKFLETVLVQ